MLTEAHLDAKRHTFLTTVLLSSELSAYAVSLERETTGGRRVPDANYGVEVIRVGIDLTKVETTIYI